MELIYMMSNPSPTFYCPRCGSHNIYKIDIIDIECGKCGFVFTTIDLQDIPK